MENYNYNCNSNLDKEEKTVPSIELFDLKVKKNTTRKEVEKSKYFIYVDRWGSTSELVYVYKAHFFQDWYIYINVSDKKTLFVEIKNETINDYKQARKSIGILMDMLFFPSIYCNQTKRIIPVRDFYNNIKEGTNMEIDSTYFHFLTQCINKYPRIVIEFKNNIRYGLGENVEIAVDEDGFQFSKKEI